MDSKKIIAKLIKIAYNQQKIIEKLAQGTPALAGPPQSLPAPVHPNLREADTILKALPLNVKPVVARIEVKGGDVYVQFHPGKESDAAFAAVQSTVQNLQQQNVLPGQSYQVRQF